MTDYTPSNSKKNKTAIYGGHPKKPIWRFFEQEEDNMFGFNCLKVDHSIREAVIYMVEVREREISSGANVKRQNNDQTILEDFYENSDLSKERKEDIDTALIKAFVCCGLPWHLVEHPFIIELFKQFRSNYSLSDRKTLADIMLTQKILRVNVKLYRLLEEESNLTLGNLGWLDKSIREISLEFYYSSWQWMGYSLEN
ncbi:unnamed protein product [Rhizophagus irregularis]|uniref:Uncharacterized protein n=1 Tax=Rhizophagus irregularis TaxID=588596 RepID=A0A916E8J3_9GLOM|nr:unnamed protein product [Rhizophagus irregularis]